MTADRSSSDARDPARCGQWLDPVALRARVAADPVTFVDVRQPSVFAKGHPAGARCLPHDPYRLGERVAAITDDDPLIVVADDADVAADAVRQLASTRWTVVGALDPAAWRSAGGAWASLPELTAATLAEGFRGTVLDVREPAEWLTGCIPGAMRIPLAQLSRRLDEVPRDAPVAVICESGVRSATAASALLAEGWGAQANVIDGMAGYRRTARPLEHPVDVGDLES